MPDNQTINAILSSYGISGLAGGGGFSLWNLLWGTVFGIIGWMAFLRGRREANWRAMVIGIALMVYTFFVGNTWLVFIIGTALTAALYFWRE
ncbi:MAG: hypothetical protein KGK03_02550 [Candidatus Omnitrophica bacterium]|nr:hypothetical protein [Candidatus Omnitrophota bacterium]MDE2221930.1 hypothetical protein [Candidatus Omnitrophota bacterium]